MCEEKHELISLSYRIEFTGDVTSHYYGLCIDFLHRKEFILIWDYTQYSKITEFVIRYHGY